jgi:uncharacterized membrane protein YcaP (DUF421 family)
MFALGTPAWEIVLRTTAVYLALLVGLRLAGKRELGQMTIFDLVVLLLLANAVQNAMVGPDTSLVGGLLAAAVLVGMNLIVAQLGIRWSVLVRRGLPPCSFCTAKARHLQCEGIDQRSYQQATWRG